MKNLQTTNQSTTSIPMPTSKTSNPKNSGAPDFYDDGYLRIEYKNFFLTCGGERVKLPRIEFLIFSRLTQSAERIVSYEDLWSYTWGDKKPLTIERFKVHMHHLRRVFKPLGIGFETMVNVGYAMIPRRTEN